MDIPSAAGNNSSLQVIETYNLPLMFSLASQNIYICLPAGGLNYNVR